MYFDTHAHYDDERFNPDRDAVLAAMPSLGVDLIVNPASHLDSALAARALAEKYPFLYFAPGIHPHEAEDAPADYLSRVEELLAHPKAVALGEIGLDYHYDFSPRDIQKRVFREQMELAKALRVPVIVHEREACADTMEILRAYPDVTGVVHCYSGSWETAKEILSLGWYISFTGVVTFKNARKAVEVAGKMPIDRMLLETDSPYMAPVPLRGQRCDSTMLPHIAQRIAEIRGVTAEEIAAVTMENGKRFFNIA